MQVHISIGENHRFELREALLIYGDRQRSFVTRHAVVHQKEGPPTLEPAQPLTLAFLESLTRSLSGSFPAEILPETVLAKGERMIAWWTPACRRKMFYENAEGKGAALNGKVFAQPPLVWRVENGELRIRALTDNKRPAANTKLCVAPLLESFRRWSSLYRHHAPSGERDGGFDPRLGARFLRKRIHAREHRAIDPASGWVRGTVERTDP